MKQQAPLSAGVTTLYRHVRAVLEQARASAYRAVNFAMVQAYWQVGRLIVENEQKGKSRAGYGEAVVASLACARSFHGPTTGCYCASRARRQDSGTCARR